MLWHTVWIAAIPKVVFKFSWYQPKVTIHIIDKQQIPKKSCFKAVDINNIKIKVVYVTHSTDIKPKLY